MLHLINLVSHSSVGAMSHHAPETEMSQIRFPPIPPHRALSDTGALAAALIKHRLADSTRSRGEKRKRTRTGDRPDDGGSDE